MERLTHKINNKYFYDVDDINVGNKLGELEDVLEKYGINNLEDFIVEYREQNMDFASDIVGLEEKLNNLQHQLTVKDKALELACIECAFFDYSQTENGKAKQKRFIKQAEKELKGEK